MMRYFKLFLYFFKSSLIKALSFRFDFVMTLLEGLSFFLVNYLFFDTVFYRLTLYQGVPRQEMMLLVACNQLFIGIFYGLFIDNVTGLKYYINRGDMDYLITKPVNPQFIISFRYVSLGHIVSAFAAIPLLIGCLSWSGTVLRPTSLLSYLICLIISLVNGYSILLFFVSLSMIFFSSANVGSMIASVIDMGKYPRQMYSGIWRIIFVVLLQIDTLSNLSKDAFVSGFEPSVIALALVKGILLLLLSSHTFRAAYGSYKSTGS